MHALCAVVGRTLQDIDRCLQDHQENEAWDYAMVGGRYCNLIPVGKKVKLINSGGWPELPGATNFPYPERMNANPDCQYTNIARIRNINHDERIRMRDGGGLDILCPYNAIICHPDGGYEWIDIDYGTQDDRDRFTDFVSHPSRSYWYVAVVDYHT